MKEEATTSQKIKKPWPTKDAMQQIYDLNLWGGNTEFYSGEGSHAPEYVTPYISAVTSFLTSFKTALTVCDLGCGDFNVGRKLVAYTKKYVAVDIVSSLIKRNQELFKGINVSFHCLDLAEDELPVGDCAILRQVLQHLSNAEVQRILTKLIQYKYIILTEHLPEGDFVPNKDIISGQGIRLKKKSGLDILAAPFHFQIQEEKELLSVTLPESKGIIVTKLYKLF